ncbi:hypothetical protein [Bradyrhizobium sp. dw_78]|uniref:hypothetical protein n=1 Tax=Bradyrhizobium sp. dw_78 TaxID=2719793 RepID=UPI001BD44DA9|nr:hypothetical protein [Bradyrhizobium sp. dw_78]
MSQDAAKAAAGDSIKALAANAPKRNREVSKDRTEIASPLKINRRIHEMPAATAAKTRPARSECNGQGGEAIHGPDGFSHYHQDLIAAGRPQ